MSVTSCNGVAWVSSSESSKGLLSDTPTEGIVSLPFPLRVVVSGNHCPCFSLSEKCVMSIKEVWPVSPIQF